MARGTKSNELQQDNTPIQFGEEILANTALGTSRVPVSAIPALANLLNFILPGDSPLTLTEALHEKRFLNLNNSAGAINVRLPDANDIWPNVGSFRRGGLFAEAVVTSTTFAVSFEGLVPGQIRAVGALSPEVLTNDVVFVGISQSLSDETIVEIYNRGGQWVLESTTGWRVNAADQDDKKIDVSAVVGRQIVDADHDIPVWLTAAAPGTLSFQSDICTGLRTTVINNGAAAAGINFGTHTPVGDASIPAGQAASILVGPVTTGVNKEIFVAASS